MLQVQAIKQFLEIISTSSDTQNNNVQETPVLLKEGLVALSPCPPISHCDSHLYNFLCHIYCPIIGTYFSFVHHLDKVMGMYLCFYCSVHVVVMIYPLFVWFSCHVSCFMRLFIFNCRAFIALQIKYYLFDLCYEVRVTRLCEYHRIKCGYRCL